MHLKSLELQGFKSFPDKTTLTFDDGATVIVGPNGSGKSNITDAMRWVLGELSTKNIRGAKLEDVIFIGTEVRKPMSFAEVSVTFDNSSEEGRLNSPYDEITVTRRYYRAGKSEYLINRNPCRLTDIYQLFMNTGVGREGYSIIGQGRIAEIISKKSEDRRNIFEEAAGISKIRHEKTETEKNLKNTQDNMDRVSDIFHELERRIGPLEREAKKAKEYLALYERKKVADISLWIYDSQRIKLDIERLENEIKMSKHELDMANDSLQQIEEQEIILAERYNQTKLEADRIYSEIIACNRTIADLDSNLAVMKNNVEHAERISSEEILEIERLEAKRIAAINYITECERRYNETRIALQRAQDEYIEIREQQANLVKKRDEISKKIDELFEKQKSFEAELNDLKVRISVIESSSNSENERTTQNTNNIDSHRRALDDMIAEAEKISEALAEYEAKIAELENLINEADLDIETKTQRYDELKEKMNALKSQSLALVERINALKSMEELFEGYARSVTFIMNSYKNGEIQGVGEIYGPVSQLIVVEEKYVTAIETALGVGLQHIVVDNEETAKICILKLKEGKAGRATFYPVSSVTPQTVTPEMQKAKKFKGYIGIANELIDVDAKFQDIFSSLLGRTVIFDNIDNATEMSKVLGYRVKVVTLDGQQINVGGSFTGGSARHESNMLSRSADIKRMQEENEAILSEIAAIKVEGQGLGEALRTLTQNRAENKQQLNILDSIYRREKAEYESLIARINDKRSLVEQLEDDIRHSAEEARRAVEELVELKRRRDEIEAIIAEIANERLELNVLKYEYEEQANDYTEKINDNLVNVTAINKDLEAANVALAEAKEKLEEILESISLRREKMERLTDDVASFEEKSNENRHAYEEALARLKAFEQERERLYLLEQQIEKKRNELNAKSKEISARKEIIARSHGMNEIKLQQLIETQEKMLERLRTEYNLEPSDAIKLGYPEVTEANKREISAILNECKQKIRELGHVNPNAIEEYEQEKERYDFLLAQLTDLEKSREFILNQIAELEQEMKTKFIAAFNAVNENFNEVFKELFGGGHAELILDNPDDVLNCGIEIKAAPPGKVIKSLMLLSGGEQSFVAIALLFAILKVNPTPFCIFDEIEAALDEVNVTRFGQYIKRYSRQTQFIVITHRRGTMEIADKLYGVTMPQKGISKVLTMDTNAVGNENILNTNNAK